MRRFIRIIAWVLFIGVLCVNVGEYELERRGYSLYWRKDLQTVINHKFYGELQYVWRRCGWGSQVGDFVSIEDPTVIETVWPNGMRECREHMDKPAPVNVALYGCSYTYGVGVRAPETFVYKLNTHYKNVCFDNYGMSGTSLIHAYNRMKYAFASGKKYDLVVHDTIGGILFRDPLVRAAGSFKRNYIYAIAPQVVSSLWRGWHIVYDQDRVWPCEDSLLTVDFMKRAYYGYKVEQEVKYEDSNVDLSRSPAPPDSWIYLAKKMRDLCYANGADFVVCSLDSGATCYNTPVEGLTIIPIDMLGSGDLKNRVMGRAEFHPNRNVHAYWSKMFIYWFDLYLAENFPGVEERLSIAPLKRE